MAWTGATVNQIEPDPGNDGIWFMGYKVTNPTAGVWHYEYALYNQNLDRAIQSFSVPLGPGVNISNIGFHAPPQHPGWANDGTFNNQGYSSTPWTVTQDANSITWNTETFAQNQNANAIRLGTLYNFRFDADQPPQSANATVGYFKTGVAHDGCDPRPSREWYTNSHAYSQPDTNTNGDCYSYGYCDCHCNRYAYCYCDTNSNGNCHANSDSYCHCNAYSYCNSDCYAYGNGHTDGYSNPNANIYSTAKSDTKIQSATKASAYSAAETLIAQ